MNCGMTMFSLPIFSTASVSVQCRQIGSTAETTARGWSSALTTASSLSLVKVLTLPSLPKSITRLSNTARPLQSCAPGKVSAVTR